MAGKRRRPRELRTLPDGDLQSELAVLRRELWEHRVKASAGALQQPHQIRALRRQVARLKTVMHERSRAPRPAPGATA